MEVQITLLGNDHESNFMFLKVRAMPLLIVHIGAVDGREVTEVVAAVVVVEGVPVVIAVLEVTVVSHVTLVLQESQTIEALRLNQAD